MILNENTGGKITEVQARILITAFDRKFPDEVVSSFIGKLNVKDILDQENCIGLRIYNGYDETNQKMSLVIVGVGQNGNDLLAGGLIYDELVTCPPTCPPGISLSQY